MTCKMQAEIITDFDAPRAVQRLNLGTDPNVKTKMVCSRRPDDRFKFTTDSAFKAHKIYFFLEPIT